ncbi:MAG: hypothetical protein IPG22_16740 [Acidobacteria bacterium]|nr:hypothetical protein [Acidobacteriota bacterium]
MYKGFEQLHRSCRVEIVSDSRYVIDTMAGLNRMRTNRLFWTRLVKACYGHHISWRWVKGHSGVAFKKWLTVWLAVRRKFVAICRTRI